MADIHPTQCDDLATRVLSAFPHTKYRWRTVRGLARELGVDEDAVAAAITSHPDLFRRSSIAPAGIALYKPREEQPILSTK